MTSAPPSFEPQLRLITDAVAALIAYIDAEHRYRYVNAAYERWLDRPRASVIGKHVRELVGEEGYQQRLPFLRLAFAGRQVHCELSTPAPMGDRRFLRIDYTPDIGADGEVRGCVVSISDLTELKRSEQRFRELADAMPQIVWSARADGAPDYYNRRFHEFTGHPEDLGADAGWEAVLHPDDLGRWRSSWDHAVRTGEPYEVECRFRDPRTGAYRWHLGRALPVKDGTGRVLRWYGTCTDIDDQKRAAEERERLLADLRQALRVRDEFLSVASHELRTPLTTLGLQTEGLLRSLARDREIDRDRLHRRAETLYGQFRRLTHLVDRLLDVSRIAAGRLQLQPEEVDLSRLVRDTVERLREQAERSGSQVTLRGAEAPLLGRWDRMRLEQVVTNLLSNAIKYGHGRPIDVTVEAADRASVQVCDRGIGIATEDQERIFGRFERASSERHYGGLGLGLWITRQIVEAMGGSITVISAPGQGSSFTIALPWSRGEG